MPQKIYLPAEVWNTLPATITIPMADGSYYLLFAGPGTTGTSSATWAVCFVELTTLGANDAYFEKWADRNRLFDNVADNYLTLTYGIAPLA